MCRINISVPNPDSAEGRVEQAFVRDPDGYYIEFCDCRMSHEKMYKREKVSFDVKLSCGTVGVGVNFYKVYLFHL